MHRTASNTAIAAATPLALSLYFALPTTAWQLSIAVTFVAMALFTRAKFPLRDLIVTVILIILCSVAAMVHDQKITFFFGTAIAFIVFKLATTLKISPNFSPTLYFHAIAISISFITLQLLDLDLISLTLYGESRHAVHVNTAITGRVSGVFQEPATLGIHMLLLSTWCFSITKDLRTAMGFNLLAILSFSSLSLLALVISFLQFFQSDLKSLHQYRLALVALIFLYLSPTVITFLADKVTVYNESGLMTSSRFEALDFALNSIAASELIFQGISSENIAKFVVYDLGLVISSILVGGIFGLVLVGIFFSQTRFRVTTILYITITKAAIIDPLTWVACAASDGHDRKK